MPCPLIHSRSVFAIGGALGLHGMHALPQGCCCNYCCCDYFQGVDAVLYRVASFKRRCMLIQVCFSQNVWHHMHSDSALFLPLQATECFEGNRGTTFQRWDPNDRHRHSLCLARCPLTSAKLLELDLPVSLHGAPSHAAG